LVEEEFVPQNIASNMLGVSLSCVNGWKSKREALSAAVSKDKLRLHDGPASILQEVE
jgi:hypothetical protein